MQTSFEFQLIENHRLLYEEIFSTVQEYIHGGLSKKSGDKLGFVEKIESDDTHVTHFKKILSRRDDLLQPIDISQRNNLINQLVM